MPGIGKYTKGKKFQLRSGNNPMFKDIGSTSPNKDMITGSYAHKFEGDSGNTPTYLKEFGIGKGTSPTDYKIKKGDTLSEIAAANNTTVEALMKANPNIKDPNKIIAGADLNLSSKDDQTKGNKEVETKSDADAIDKGVGDTKQPKVNKWKTRLNTMYDAAVQGFTTATDSVYGTGIVPADGDIIYSDKEKNEKDEETGEQKVDKLINK